jgi:nitrite reductase/ring-hydroxylating ferredoxin subunit
MSAKKIPNFLKLAAMDEIQNGQSKKFIIHRPDRETEAFLIKTNGQYYAYLNLCRHWTVGLDFDDNDFFSEDSRWLICKNHGAVYHPVTGQCESGPCGGAALYKVPLVEKKGFIYADLEKIDWGD